MLAELLRVGEANAIPASELSRITGMSKRQVFEIAAKERGEGHYIVASSRGLYLAANEEELQAYIAFTLRRVRRELYTIRHIRKAARQIRGQETII